jgi:hypothetical protein
MRFLEDRAIDIGRHLRRVVPKGGRPRDFDDVRPRPPRGRRPVARPRRGPVITSPRHEDAGRSSPFGLPCPAQTRRLLAAEADTVVTPYRAYSESCRFGILDRVGRRLDPSPPTHALCASTIPHDELGRQDLSFARRRAHEHGTRPAGPTLRSFPPRTSGSRAGRASKPDAAVRP